MVSKIYVTKGGKVLLDPGELIQECLKDYAFSTRDSMWRKIESMPIETAFALWRDDPEALMRFFNEVVGVSKKRIEECRRKLGRALRRALANAEVLLEKWPEAEAVAVGLTWDGEIKKTEEMDGVILVNPEPVEIGIKVSALVYRKAGKLPAYKMERTVRWLTGEK